VAVLLEGAGEASHLCTLEPLDLVLELHVDVAHLPLLLLHPDNEQHQQEDRIMKKPIFLQVFLSYFDH
jgi:hypothetical protein